MEVLASLSISTFSDKVALGKFEGSLSLGPEPSRHGIDKPDMLRARAPQATVMILSSKSKSHVKRAGRDKFVNGLLLFAFY